MLKTLKNYTIIIILMVDIRKQNIVFVILDVQFLVNFSLCLIWAQITIFTK